MRSRKIAVVGSRDFVNSDLIDLYISKLNKDVTIISGGARGVDLDAELAAQYHGLKTVIFYPDYKKYPGKRAPIERNKLIVNECDELVAFWDGKSKGTKSAIDMALKQKKPVTIIYDNESQVNPLYGEL